QVKGELDISAHGSELDEIWLEPMNARPLPEVLNAVDEADVILLGPGSLFTSVIPNLLLPDFADKLKDSPIPKIYICNLMTQPEETQGMNILQHLEWVSVALGTIPDFLIVNSEPIPEDIIEAYKREGAGPLFLDYRQREAIKNMGCIAVEAPIMSVFESSKEGRVVRHDPQKLASVIFRLVRRLDD
ncbi:MAG: YvcK family protein, partial [Synergistaceae bacterium]|nr:YvcK family protein [Synergistaceae bacterium]